MEYPLYESSKEITLCVPMENIVSVDLQSFIEEETQKKVSLYHNGEGIVLPDSVSILSRSPLILNPKDSTYNVIVRYKGKVVDTPNGSMFNARVESVLSSGLLCHVYHTKVSSPLIRVYVPLTVHTSAEQMRIGTIRKNDIVRVKSINRKGSLSDKIITTIATFIDLVERPDEEIEPVSTKSLPAPADESKYDAGGDGDPLGPHADGMAPSLPIQKQDSEEGEGVEGEEEEKEGEDEVA
jgi:hypothetical protein